MVPLGKRDHLGTKSGTKVLTGYCFNIFLGVVFGDVFLFIPKGTLAGLGGLFE